MEVSTWIESHQAEFTALSDQIWTCAETGYQEKRSARALADVLAQAGFEIEYGVAGIPTAFVASYGQGKPVIAILGEYDALPGLSQQAVPQRVPVVEGGNGHGCGHNLLGVAALAAALAVQQAIQAGEAVGTVRYYGCPAEENGSGKAFMVRAGLFQDVDLSLTWHPSNFNGTITVNFLANIKVKFRFHGTASHAAADPHNGRSALDAVELMNVGANYLREHIIPDARLHYVILNGGGIAPNVVPPFAESLYLIRAPRPDQLKPIYERVVDIARGAALMTGTRMENQVISGASNLVINETIVDVMQAQMEAIGPPSFSQADLDFARTISTTFPEGNDSSYERMLGPNAREIVAAAKKAILYTELLPIMPEKAILPGSTDVGDVSWVTPTGQINTTCYAFGTSGHSWQLVAQAGMGIGHKGMLFAGKVLAASALAFMADPQLLGKAQDEHRAHLAESPFVALIPDGVQPPLRL
jgi:aminobenzoyl-glutamate utilization protein B